MNILVTAPYPEDELSALRRLGSVYYDPWTTRGKPFTPTEMVRTINQCRASLVVTELDPIDRSVLSKVKLQAIGVCRGTPVNVDVAQATQDGIFVFRTPGRNAQAVAELAR